MERDSVLGWRMVPGQASRAIARRADATVYDVTYTTDSLGHRIAPPAAGAGARGGCVWFVVCSFTFGEGVGDTATLPYRVGMRTAGRFQIVNFGVPGYGAEHFLAALERDMRILRPPCAPTHVVYQALQQHVLRAAGRTEFSAYGPRYRLGADGRPVFTGTPVRPAATDDNSLRARLSWQLTKSRLFRLLSDRTPTATPDDWQLYLAILRETRERLAARYPDAALHVLGWGTSENRSDGEFQDSLAAVIPNYHRVADIIRDLGTAGTKYQIPHDGHPNALAYDLLARYVAEHILTAPAATPAASAPR
jgi:hypothetical protein